MDNKNFIGLPPTSLLHVTDVIKITGLARPTIYKWISQGRFPHSVKIGSRRVGWRFSEVMDWLDDPSSYSSAGSKS